MFAHGRSDNGLCFWPIAKQFANDYEIILYDARNHGRSENPESTTSLMNRVQDLAGLIEALGLQKTQISRALIRGGNSRLAGRFLPAYSWLYCVRRPAHF